MSTAGQMVPRTSRINHGVFAMVIGIFLLGLPGMAHADDPVMEWNASFEFLLEREPKESILRRFDLPVIERYFPEFPRKIRDLLKE